MNARCVSGESEDSGQLLLEGCAENNADRIGAYFTELECAYDHPGGVVGSFRQSCKKEIWFETTGLDPQKYRLKKPVAWATDANHLKRLRELGGVGIQIQLTTGETLVDFDDTGFVVERGHGSQTALTLENRKYPDVPGQESPVVPVIESRQAALVPTNEARIRGWLKLYTDTIG